MSTIGVSEECLQPSSPTIPNDRRVSEDDAAVAEYIDTDVSVAIDNSACVGETLQDSATNDECQDEIIEIDMDTPVIIDDSDYVETVQEVPPTSDTDNVLEYLDMDNNKIISEHVITEEDTPVNNATLAPSTVDYNDINNYESIASFLANFTCYDDLSDIDVTEMNNLNNVNNSNYQGVNLAEYTSQELAEVRQNINTRAEIRRNEEEHTVNLSQYNILEQIAHRTRSRKAKCNRFLLIRVDDKFPYINKKQSNLNARIKINRNARIRKHHHEYRMIRKPHVYKEIDYMQVARPSLKAPLITKLRLDIESFRYEDWLNVNRVGPNLQYLELNLMFVRHIPDIFTCFTLGNKRLLKVLKVNIETCSIPGVIDLGQFTKLTLYVFHFTCNDNRIEFEGGEYLFNLVHMCDLNIPARSIRNPVNWSTTYKCLKTVTLSASNNVDDTFDLALLGKIPPFVETLYIPLSAKTTFLTYLKRETQLVVYYTKHVLSQYRLLKEDEESCPNESIISFAYVSKNFWK